MANIEHRRVSQSGAALLFALGILSLLLISGVAFLGNALITQKVMLNNEESASAKTLSQQGHGTFEFVQSLSGLQDRLLLCF